MQLFKLWELKKETNSVMISQIRVDRGTFSDYDAAMEEAHKLGQGRAMSAWEVEVIKEENAGTYLLDLIRSYHAGDEVEDVDEVGVPRYNPRKPGWVRV